MFTLDEGKRKGVGCGMGLFLSGGHWPKIRPQNSQVANQMCVGNNDVFGKWSGLADCLLFHS